MFEEIGAAETLEKAVELIGYGRELPEDEAIGVAVGWWPSFGIPSGAYVKLNGDGSGTIITGAQECGTGAVMALPLLAAEELGMRPEDFSLLYQDTDAGPFDSGASGSQTTFNNGRAVIEAARDVREQLLDLAAEKLEANRDDLVLADGAVSVKGSPSSKVTIPELAEAAHGDKLLLGRGADAVPAMPDCDASGCTGRLGSESFLAPTFITHAVRCKVDRETGVVRVLEVAAVHESGRVLNPIGANGQVEGGVVMGIGMATLEGTLVGDDGRQRNPHLLDYKLQTASDSPPISIAWVDAPTKPGAGGPKGSKGVGEPPCVPTPGAIANAIAKVTGARVHRLPMTPARVWEACQPMSADTYTAAAQRRGGAAGDGVGRAPDRRRHRPGGGSPRRQVAAARVAGGDPRPGRAARDRGRTAATSCCGRWQRTPTSSHSAAACERFTALADASAIVGSHATRNAGTIGGNLMNASPAMETGGPLICFDATVTLQRRSSAGRRPRTGSARELRCGAVRRPRGDDRGRRRAADVGASAGAGTGHRQLLRTARVPPPDGDRDRRRHRAWSRSTAARSATPASPSRRSRQPSAGWPRRRRRWSEATAARRPPAPPRTPPRRPRSRSPTYAARPTTAARWRP